MYRSKNPATVKFRVLLLMFVVFLGLSGLVFGQLGQKPPVPPTQIVILSLKHAQASELKRVLQNVNPDCQIEADQHTNSLLVNGTKEKITACLELARELDQPIVQGKGGETNPRILAVSKEILENYGEVIATFSQWSETSIAMDPSLGVIMIRGGEREVERLKQVIATIQDSVVSQKQMQSHSVRILWLQSKAADAPAYEFAPELKAIVSRLAALGIKDLALTTQLIARCDDDLDGKGEFQISGGGVETGEVEVTGKLRTRVDQSGSQRIFGKFEITVPSTTPSISVNIQLEANKFYVISSAPIDGQHSVFIVQVLSDL